MYLIGNKYGSVGMGYGPGGLHGIGASGYDLSDAWDGYMRSQANMPLPTSDEKAQMSALMGGEQFGSTTGSGWTLYPRGLAKLHQNINSGIENFKFVHSDGREYVMDIKK